MKLQTNKLSLSSAVAAAVLYVICWAFVAALPDLATTVTENMLHTKFDDIAWKMTPSSLIVGTFTWGLATGFAVWLVAVLYNRMSRASDSFPI